MLLPNLSLKTGSILSRMPRCSHGAEDISHTRIGGSSAIMPCTNCITCSHCFSQKLTPFELTQYATIIDHSRMIKKGVLLYRPNDAFQNVYMVRSGSFKTCVLHRNGKEQITGFYFAGELLGLDGICTQQYSCYVEALENSSVCAIPFQLLETICHRNKILQHYLYCVMSNKIVRDASLLLLLGTLSAEQRVAAFLLDISQRCKAQGYAANEFTLRMSREEIGSYLGLKLETVSRVLSRFHKIRLVDTHNKHIIILDLIKLASI